MKQPSALSALVEALRVLPGVGPKSAQRMAVHLMQHDREGAERLGRSLLFATEHLQHCEKCNTFTEAQICEVCSDEERDPTLLCVVETPADQIMLEQTMTYRGLYFVLMGRLARSTGSARRKSISTASCGARPMVSSRKSCSRPTSRTKAKPPRTTSARR